MPERQVQHMQIQRLARSDAGQYRALMLQALAHDPEAWITTAAERELLPLDWWEDRIAHRDGQSMAFGALMQGKLAGTAGVRFERMHKTRHRATLFGLYVDPRHRGSGLGRQLLQAALDHARSQDGTTVVQLHVVEGNACALALYESFGFTTFAVEPRALHDAGTYRAIIHLWRDLSTDASG